MAITVLSPYSGQPVKVRDQDVGRGVEDADGKLFYVLPKSDGTGYYGAMTKLGGPQDEARALRQEAKTHGQAAHAQAVQKSPAAPAKAAGGMAKLVVLMVIVAAAALAYIKFTK